MWIIISHRKKNIQLVDVFLTKHPPFFLIENCPDQKCHVDIMLGFFLIHHWTKYRPSKFWMKFKVEQVVRVLFSFPFLPSHFSFLHSRFCTLVLTLFLSCDLSQELFFLCLSFLRSLSKALSCTLCFL